MFIWLMMPLMCVPRVKQRDCQHRMSRQCSQQTKVLPQWRFRPLTTHHVSKSTKVFHHVNEATAPSPWFLLLL